MATVIAIDLQQVRCAVVALSIARNGIPQVVAGASLPVGPDLPKALREFRRASRLPARARLVLWPQLNELGVTPVDRRPVGSLAILDAFAVRQRAQLVVQSGFRVGAVTRPHVALATLVTGVESGLAIALERTMGCAVIARDGEPIAARYFSWGDQAEREPTGPSLERRYRLASVLGTQIRALVQTERVPIRQTLVCGGLSSLRARVAPLVAALDLDHDAEVLDASFIGGAVMAGPSEEHASVAPFQLAAAAALPARALGQQSAASDGTLRDRIA